MECTKDFTLSITESTCVTEIILSDLVGIEDSGLSGPLIKNYQAIAGVSVSSCTVTIKSPTLKNFKLGVVADKSVFGTNYYVVAPNVIINGVDVPLVIATDGDGNTFWQFTIDVASWWIFRDANNCVPLVITLSGVNTTTIYGSRMKLYFYIDPPP